MEGKDLRKAGLKVTLPRLKILEILEGSKTRHLSAEDIYRTLLESNEDIGLATVYRVLTQFEAAGLVTRHHFEDGMAVFELNQGTHHDHIVCLDCGRVEEFMDAGIEERQNAVAQQARLRDQRPLADPLRALQAPELPAQGAPQQLALRAYPHAHGIGGVRRRLAGLAAVAGRRRAAASPSRARAPWW